MSEEIKNINEQPEQAPVEKVEAKKPLDKKTIAIIAAAAAVVVLVLVLVFALGGKKDYKLGMGVVVSLDSSKTGTAQVDATVATVVLDKDGKIVACRIDVAQNKVGINADGSLDIPKTFKTKMELLGDYGMAGKVDNNGDGVMLEWYEQAKLFEEYVVGMTVSEVEAIETQLVNNHNIAKDEDLLKAGCTVQITDFQAAIVKACKDEQGVEFQASGKFTLGVAANSYDDGSEGTILGGVVAVYSDFAASVVKGDKILASLNDAIQPGIAYGPAGTILAKEYVGTKRELKENYNMAKFGASMDNNGDGKVLEWYQQSAAFSAHVVGMTADEVKDMATKEVGDHLISTDEALLSAGCTIQITGIKDVVAKSAANAR